MIGSNLFFSLKIVYYWFETKSSCFSLSDDHHIDKRVFLSPRLFLQRREKIQVYSVFLSAEKTDRSGSNTIMISSFNLMDDFLPLYSSPFNCFSQQRYETFFSFSLFFCLKSPLYFLEIKFSLSSKK